MRVLKESISIVWLILLLALASHAHSAATIKYSNASDPMEKKIQKELMASGIADSLVSFINEYFRLNEGVEFFFGGDDGPLFDGEINKIIIPYAFIEEVEHRFKLAKYDKSGVSSEEATMDALMHTLFHELAHALILMYELPIVGREEDAADSLATYLLIEYYEDGQEIALSAADLFDIESDDKSVLVDEDFWGEHSLDDQRYFSILCHVYGSDPEKYSMIPEEAQFSSDRAELCIEEYEVMSLSWQKLLKPYRKTNQAH